MKKLLDKVREAFTRGDKRDTIRNLKTDTFIRNPKT